WHRSGAPLPACSAVRSFVYCGVPWPALTTFTLIAGYFASNSATSAAMFGTHVQKVSVVGVAIALSMSAWLTGAPPAAPEPPLPLPLLHAASAALSETAPVTPRKRRRLIGDWMPKGVDLGMAGLPPLGR